MAVANPQTVSTSSPSEYSWIDGWLTKRGVEYTYQGDFPLYTIDRDASLKNQARVGAPLLEEVVERYTIAMSNDAQFPPIVVYAAGKNKYIVIDGNHRLQAAIRAEKPLDAYVVTNPSPEQISILTYESNVTHGEPTTLAEREQQALDLVNRGISATDAAKIMGVRLARLEYLTNDQRATERLVALGYDANDFGITARRRLNNIHSDVVLSQMASLVKDAKLTYEQVDEIVPRINAQRNEAQQLSVVTEARRDFDGVIKATAGGSVTNRNVRPLVRLNNIVTRIRDFQPEMLNIEMDEVTKDQLRVALLDATRRLAAVLERLN